MRNGVKVNFSYCATHANLSAAAAQAENTEYANNAVNEIRTAEYHVRNTYATHKKPMAVWLLLGWPTHGVKSIF